MNRPRPDEAAVREALSEEKERVEEEQPAAAVAEDGSTDEGAGDGPAPAQSAADAEPEAAEAETAEPEPEEDPLTRAQREAAEYLDLAKRTQADFENYRKRAAKDIAAASGRARAGLIRELLPVLDNLERALTAAPAEGDGFAEGVRLVLMDLHGVLSRAGVEPIEPKGEPFDPNLHEALTTRQEEGVDAGVVLDVVEKGYKGADQVIRPARVIVAA